MSIGRLKKSGLHERAEARREAHAVVAERRKMVNYFKTLPVKKLRAVYAAAKQNFG